MILVLGTKGRRAPFAISTASLLTVVGLFLPWLPTVLPAAAAEPEARDFAVLVDGKKVGEYHALIKEADDGTITLMGRSDVRVTVLAVPVYTYSYQAQEVWKNGRVQRFESSGKENSRRFAISAVAESDLLRVTGNGKSYSTRPDVLLTSCWQLPVAALRNGPVAMLGCDTGVITTGQVQFVGTEKIMVAGQEQECAHYRVTKNNVPHDFWYDGQERMVRDEWLSEGNHRTVLDLTQIQR
jgi:hypothetical protein